MVDELFLELRILAAQAGGCRVRGAEEVGADRCNPIRGEGDALLQRIDEGKEVTFNG